MTNQNTCFFRALLWLVAYCLEKLSPLKLVLVGDCIIAVNEHGFRRFARDYMDEQVENLSPAVKVDLDYTVVSSGNAYQNMLAKLKAVKAANGDPPLILTQERYGWDARCNAWARFQKTREGAVPAAMQMYQEHEAWREKRFPIDLKQPGLQTIFKEKAVSGIDLVVNGFPPTVYVNYGKLQQLQTAGDITAEDVVAAFVIFTERMLAQAKDPRHPQTCQFIDLSGVSITSGFRVESLKQIYNTFEPNYPETLFKMVIYPVSSLMVRTHARTVNWHESSVCGCSHLKRAAAGLDKRNKSFDKETK